MNEWEWNLLEDKTAVDHVEIGGVKVRKGDRVRLRPAAAGTFWTLRCAVRSRPSRASNRITKASNTSAWFSKMIPGATWE